ncbi:MAG: hypothetical protein K8L91_17885 [Anaerolineae bacterium]|nr:hypothetical protein [Anaerolineae bacterium]
MTLFFYGAIELKDDRTETIRLLLELGRKVGWALSIGEILDRHSFNSLFNLPESRQQEFLVFEVDPSHDIYDDYGGVLMEQQYRKIARDIGLPHWESIGFGSSDLVDQIYKANPQDITLVRFLKGLFELFPAREIIICFDQNYDNHLGCPEIIGDQTTLMREAWLTIAYGYSWPNLRLKLRAG